MQNYSPITGKEGWLLQLKPNATASLLSAKTQIFIAYDNSVIMQRVLDWSVQSWSNWKEISTDIPAFYKDYGTLSALSSAISALLPLDSDTTPEYEDDTDCNTLVNTGRYAIHTTGTVSPEDMHKPTGSDAAIIVIRVTAYYILQFHIDQSNGLYVRCFGQSSGWKSWAKIV